MNYLPMTELRQFQLEGVKQIYHFSGRALLADEQGLGKTLESLYWLLKIPKRRPVIIVTPSSMKYTWQAEAHLHFNMHTEVIDGHLKGRRTLPTGRIIILNYDLLKSWLPALIKAKPHVLILDEIHRIKNPKAIRTKAVIALSKQKSISSVVGLSGTPMTNRPVELWAPLQAIRPDLFPSFTKFCWRYTRPKYTPWGWTFNGSANEKELNAILKREVMIRRLKKDVLPELPDKVRRPVSFKLSSYKEYDEAEKDFLKWLSKLSPSKAKRAAKSQALTKVGYLLRLCARLKLEWTTKWIEDFFESNPDEKLVGFTMHTFVVDHLKEKFGHRCVVVDGRVTGRKRVESVRLFQSNKRVSLFVGNWIAAGVGITLTAAHNFAALDFPWTPGDLVQGEDRIHRIGQKKNCYIHYLAVLGTIEAKLIQILKQKSKTLDAILDGGRSPNNLDIFDVLLREMRKDL